MSKADKAAQVTKIKELIASEKWGDAEAIVVASRGRISADDFCPAPDAHHDQVDFYGECQWCYLAVG